MRKTLLHNKKRNIFLIIIVIFFLYVVSNIIIICSYSYIDETQAADVAIILGAATYPEEVSPVYRERLNHGITLHQQGYVKKIIVTGGIGSKNKHSDAYTAKQYLLGRGIPDADIIIEDKSTITQENLQNAKVLMDKNGHSTAIIVSDPLHMKRSMLLAKDIGIQCYSSPTPTTMYQTLKTQIPFLARELFSTSAINGIESSFNTWNTTPLAPF